MCSIHGTIWRHAFADNMTCKDFAAKYRTDNRFKAIADAVTIHERVSLFPPHSLRIQYDEEDWIYGETFKGCEILTEAEVLKKLQEKNPGTMANRFLIVGMWEHGQAEKRFEWNDLGLT